MPEFSLLNFMIIEAIFDTAYGTSNYCVGTNIFNPTFQMLLFMLST